MLGKRMRIMTGLFVVCFMALSSACGQGEKVKVKGLITIRTGETIVLKTTDGNVVTVALDDDTKVQQPKGLGMRKQKMSAAVLIPGLKVSVDGTGQDPAHGRAENRRVEVKVLINKGIAGI